MSQIIISAICALFFYTAYVTAQNSNNTGFYNGTNPVPFPPKSNKTIGSHIIGGTTVNIIYYPWQASMRINGAHNCGASVISTLWVLTAGHCMNNALAATTFYFGSSSRTSGGVLRSAITMIRHPSYNTGQAYHLDVGVYKLSAALAYSPYIQPIALPVQGQSIPGGQNTWVSGWGRTSVFSSALPDKLYAVVVPTVPYTTCQATYGTKITWSMFCAGYAAGGKDSCQGDSGGPLVGYVGSSLQQIGIVSWGYGCAQPNLYGVYTYVPNVRDWIKQNTGV